MDFNKHVHRVQTYFIAAVILKATLAVTSLLLNEPFWLGFVLPLLVMCCYWFVGYRVREKWNVQLTLEICGLGVLPRVLVHRWQHHHLSSRH